MATNTDPVVAYFAGHAGFVHNPGNASFAEFNRLMASRGHAPKSKAYRREQRLYAAAFVGHVTTTYGEGRASLAQWQALCRVCSIASIPSSITKCRQALRRVYVNIFDAMDALETGGMAPTFRDVPSLRSYSVGNGKVIPRRHAKAGGAVRDLLRQLF